MMERRQAAAATVEQIAAAATSESAASLAAGLAKIEHCLAQLTDEQVWNRPADDMNSIGNLLLHLAGNVRQWIVSGAGDRPDTRDRPAEFAQRQVTPQGELLENLRAAVQEASDVLANIGSTALLEGVRVQGFEVSRMHAVVHSTTHFQGHVQEIICLTRQQLGAAYRFDWTPQTKEQGA